MALTSEEQIEQYQSLKKAVRAVERNIDDLNSREEIVGHMWSGVGSMDLYVDGLTVDQGNQIKDMIVKFLEENYEHMSAELEEMLK